MASIVFALTLLVLDSFAQQPRELSQSKPKVSDKRTALVIGNANYTHATKLRNPKNDAEDMAKALEELGFEVIAGTDLTRRQMRERITNFGDRLKANGGIGLFYYAGHGIQVNGINYLIPIEAEIPREQFVADEGIPMDTVFRTLDIANNGFNIVILDACRNNPFARGWTRSFDTGGLAISSPPTGTFIAYATDVNKTADDGQGRNGIYTGELLKQIRRPNVKLQDLFQEVGRAVRNISGGKQIPWLSSSVFGDFYFRTVVASAADSLAKSRMDQESEAWELIKGSPLSEAFREFLKEFPAGKFSLSAKIKLEETSWRFAREKNDYDAIQNFLAEFPNGANAATARVLSRKLKADRDSKRPGSPEVMQRPNGIAADSESDNTAWNAIAKSRDVSAIQNFISRFPLSPFREIAELRLNNLKIAKIRTEKAISWYRRLYSLMSAGSVVRETSSELLIDPMNPVPRTFRGLAYLSVLQRDRGLNDVQMAVSTLISRNDETFDGLAAICATLTFNQIPSLSSQLDDGCNRLVQLYPENPWSWTVRAGLRNEVANANVIIDDLDKAIEIDPDFSFAYLQRGRIATAMGKYDYALRNFDKVVQLKELDTEGLLGRRSVLLAKGDSGGAEIEFNKALQSSQDIKIAYFTRLNELLTMSDSKGAIEYLSTVIIKAFPADVNAYFARGMLHFNNGNFSAAVVDFDKSIEIDPENPLLFGRRAESYRFNKKLDKAIEDYSTAIKLGNSPDDYVARADCYQERRNYDLAVADLISVRSLVTARGKDQSSLDVKISETFWISIITKKLSRVYELQNKKQLAMQESKSADLLDEQLKLLQSARKDPKGKEAVSVDSGKQEPLTTANQQKPEAIGSVKVTLRESGSTRGVQNQELVLPEISSEIRGINGTVVVMVDIDKNGKVISAKAISGPRLLHAPSTSAAMRSTFRRVESTGAPIKTELLYEFDSATQDVCTERPLRILRQPKANYTQSALLAKIEGEVTLDVEFLPDGQIGGVDVINKLPSGLDGAAISAAKLIEFLPECREGILVPVKRNMTYTFTLLK